MRLQVLHHLRLERLLEVERTAGRDADQEERDRDDQEERRDRGEEAAEDEGEHGLRTVIPGLAKREPGTHRLRRSRMSTGLWLWVPGSALQAAPG